MFVSLYVYDRRLKTEYLNYHDQWIKDGSPLGMFSIPEGTRLFSGGFQGWRYVFSGYLRTLSGQ